MEAPRRNPGAIASLAATTATLFIFAGLALADRTPAALVAAGSASATPADSVRSDFDRFERGRYVLEIGACHDCHTPGYVEAAGKVPVKDHLVGDKLGWQGPWGTTYASNLRQVIGAMTEDQWVAYAKAMEPRPPMPWFNVRAMSEQDLRAIHVYVAALGPAGEPAPAYVPPGKRAQGPVVLFPSH